MVFLISSVIASKRDTKLSDLYLFCKKKITFMIISSKVFILSARKFGDSSLIINAFTRELGKLSFIAKGAKSKKSKFIGSTDLLSLSNFQFIHKANRDLQLLTDSETVSPYKVIKNDLDRITVAMLISESLNQTQMLGAENIALFDITIKCLDLLNDKEFPWCLVLPLFEIRHAENSGYQIDFKELDFDMNDNLEFVYVSYIDSSASKNMGRFRGNYIKLSFETFKLLNRIKNKIDGISEANINIKEICHYFEGYFSYHLDKKFRYNSTSLFAE